MSSTTLLAKCFCLLIAYLMGFVCGKYCGNVDVRSNLTDFRRLEGCKVVAGFLQIVLFERATVGTFENISFPELEEITGYFLVFQVSGLLSIGKMFPNLKIVRGLEVINNHAFILYRVDDLEEVLSTFIYYTYIYNYISIDA